MPASLNTLSPERATPVARDAAQLNLNSVPVQRRSAAIDGNGRTGRGAAGAKTALPTNSEARCSSWTRCGARAGDAPLGARINSEDGVWS